MKLANKLALSRVRRTFRVRNRTRKTGRLRLSVFRSNNHIYAQIIDDTVGRTLVAASTREKGIADTVKNGGNKDAAAHVGRALAARAVDQGITEVAFDRGPYRYHGRVAALAEAAREAGLVF